MVRMSELTDAERRALEESAEKDSKLGAIARAFLETEDSND